MFDDAVELIAVAIILIHPRDADVIAEVPVRRRAADFELRLMIECRSADAELNRSLKPG